jgi:hypothetical protein
MASRAALCGWTSRCVDPSSGAGADHNHGSRRDLQPAIAEDNRTLIGGEDRAMGIDVSLQPFINIDRNGLQGFCYIGLGRNARRYVHQCGVGPGDAGRASAECYLVGATDIFRFTAYTAASIAREIG